MIHSLSDVQSKNIGEDTNIWQYCVVLPKAKIGNNCNICSHCFIENDVVIGDRVYNIENLVYVGDYHEGTTLGANQKVIDGKIYDFTNATEGDVYVKPTDINPDTQVVINGIVYNKENAE
ncbi:N-acetyltransferase [bacterium]|nr:N-acetyltransferase [bacterium]